MCPLSLVLLLASAVQAEPPGYKGEKVDSAPFSKHVINIRLSQNIMSCLQNMQRHCR